MGFIRKLKTSFSVLKRDYYSVEHEKIEYIYRNPSLNKKLNVLSHPLTRLNQKFFPPKPHIIQVGVTTVCNLECRNCYRERPSWNRPARHLHMETFKKFYETFRKYLMFILYWEWGEPFEHPELEDMIRISSNDNVPSVTFTNGIISLADDRLKNIVDSGLSLIQICVDAARQEDFAKTRPVGKLKDVFKNIESLSNIKKKLGSDYPVIMFRTHATKHNEKDIPRLRDIAKDLGADIFSLKAVRPFDYDGYNFDETLVPKNNKLCRYNYTTEEKKPESRVEKVKIKKFTCGKPLFLPTLDSDGYLRMCSYGGDEHRIGNIENGNSIEDVWYGKHARQIRNDFIRNHGAKLCKTCYFRSAEMPSPIIETTVFNNLPKDISVVA